MTRSMDDIVAVVDDVELSNLWHLSRATGKTSRHERAVWVAAEYARLHPDHGSATGIYKAMERYGIGEYFLTPAQVALRDTRARRRELERRGA